MTTPQIEKSDRSPSALTPAERNLRVSVVSVGALIVPMTLASQAAMPHVEMMRSMWLGFAFACLAVLAGIVLMAAARSSQDLVVALRRFVNRIKGIPERKTSSSGGGDKRRELSAAA